MKFADCLLSRSKMKYSTKCLKSLLLNSATDSFLYQTAFPIQFVITIIGNTLTLSVLLSSHMRNRANHLLAALAVADMVVFIFMLPNSLASFGVFHKNTYFRIFYAYSKTHFAAIANWFSCAAIWIVLAVSVERLLIIKFPFRSLKPYHTAESAVIAVVIFIFTLTLTSYHHFSHRCALLWVCNMTQVYIKCLPVSWNWTAFGLEPYHQPSGILIFYINTSVIANALIGVIIPVFVVAFLNVSLIRLLRIRTQQAESEAPLGPASSNFYEQERKMTITVVAIVSCFTITQLPSAILFLYEKLISDAKTNTFTNISCITNFLVLTGKMLNVVLFCLTSVTFRRKFFSTVRVWFRKFTCQQTKYLQQSNMLNRSITQKSSLFSMTSIGNQKCRQRSSSQALSSVQLMERKPIAHGNIINDNPIILYHNVQ